MIFFMDKPTPDQITYNSNDDCNKIEINYSIANRDAVL